jgi:hypothetical protein
MSRPYRVLHGVLAQDLRGLHPQGKRLRERDEPLDGATTGQDRAYIGYQTGGRRTAMPEMTESVCRSSARRKTDLDGPGPRLRSRKSTEAGQAKDEAARDCQLRRTSRS